MADQERFHFTLPETDGPSRWGGLSQAARETVAATSDSGLAGELLGKDEVTGDLPSPLGAEAFDWASAQINSEIQSWNRHDLIWYKNGPKSAEEIAAGHNRYDEVIAKLFNAHAAFYKSGETDPAGDNIGDSMELILLPWRELQDNPGHSLEKWIGDLRGQERVSGGYISQYVLSLLDANLPIYRLPEVSSDLLRPDEYLQYKIETDGDWGIMLTQTDALSGIPRLNDQCPDELVGRYGTERLKFDGYPVDMMGIFEWICLRLQRSPNNSCADNSWLLANFVNEPSDGPSRVLQARWFENWVQIGHGLSDEHQAVGELNGAAAPRLTVL